MRKRATKEQRVAEKMVDLVNDLTLDLDAVGMYIASESTTTLYNRLDTVIDSAKETKEKQYERTNHLFD